MDVTSTEPPFQRRVIIGRGLGWGIVGGTAVGAFTWTVLCVQAGEWTPLTLIGVAGLIGAFPGAALGLAAGVALALSGRWVASRMYLAQLLTGGVVTAIPVAIVSFSRSRTDWAYVYYLSPLNLTVVAALTAALLTPRIVTGAPGRRDRKRPGARRPGAVR